MANDKDGVIKVALGGGSVREGMRCIRNWG